MELRHLRYFQALAEELNFSRAADRVHIVQSALSKRIAALERELGIRLFHRTSRGVELTKAGRTLKEKLDTILPTLDAAVESARLTASGELGRLEIGFIAAAMWSVLPPILQQHRDRHPNVVFRLHELLMAGEHLEALIDGSLDAAIVRPIGRFRRLAFEPLLREQFVAVLPEGHPLATRDVVALAELADERFVLMPGPAYPEAHELYQQACVDAGFIPTIVDQGDSPNALYMVGVGFGVALAPASVESLRLPGITIKPLKDRTPEVELAIAYRKDNQSETLGALLSTARDVARANADALGLSAVAAGS